MNYDTILHMRYNDLDANAAVHCGEIEDVNRGCFVIPKNTTISCVAYTQPHYYFCLKLYPHFYVIYYIDYFIVI